MSKIEVHPLKPFLPSGGTILFLGSFPPPKARWSMDFFYPNFINDFWRIMGIIFFADKEHFVVKGEKRFDFGVVAAFAQDKGFGFFDIATKVNRLKDNASDEFLEIVEPTDIRALLRQMPDCRRIVTTGGKASRQLMLQFGIEKEPKIGTFTRLNITAEDGKELFIEWWRMPSSSRAYPLNINKKADFYRMLFE